MSVINAVEKKYKKSHVVDVKSGDTVRVHQKIHEGNKERVQVFEGLVIKTSRRNSLTSSITVRRIASGVGVEKTYMLHSPLITKIQVVKRSKVRRNYLSYMRSRTGKAARLASVDFDQEAVNAVHDEQADAEEAKLHEQAAEEAKKKAEAKAKEEAAIEAKAAAVLASHETVEKSQQETEAHPNTSAGSDRAVKEPKADTSKK